MNGTLNSDRISASAFPLEERIIQTTQPAAFCGGLGVFQMLYASSRLLGKAMRMESPSSQLKGKQ